MFKQVKELFKKIYYYFNITKYKYEMTIYFEHNKIIRKWKCKCTDFMWEEEFRKYKDESNDGRYYLYLHIWIVSSDYFFTDFKIRDIDKISKIKIKYLYPFGMPCRWITSRDIAHTEYRMMEMRNRNINYYYKPEHNELLENDYVHCLGNLS